VFLTGRIALEYPEEFIFWQSLEMPLSVLSFDHGCI